MNVRQRIALDNHCRLACETINPRFGARHHQHTIVLSVNSGYE